MLTKTRTQANPPMVLAGETAADLMRPNPVSIRENATVQEAARIVEAVQERLRDRFHITHSTLQVDNLQDEIIAPGDVARMNRP